jgi:endonuclease YncB( thermonuclease family)
MVKIPMMEMLQDRNELNHCNKQTMRCEARFSQKAFVFCLLLTLSLRICADVLIGRVVGITDGDTITVLEADKTEHKVRLMGIDAPEKSQDFGATSKQALSNYIYQREVTVDYKKFDKYKRIVGKVILDKQDVCLAMIELGLAWHYKDYAKEQSKTDRDLYSQAELKAREAKIGLWQDNKAIEPSAFRHK